jgi:precorrin-2 dehydrogenase / sirohydrochlorin ferrochelatase
VSGYPVILSDLEHARCVVIGAGKVAARKVAGLLEAGARPIVISPELCPELCALEGCATILCRPYQQGDLDGAFLVIAATDDRAINREIAETCRRRGILVNVVDRPELCTFTAPAVVRRGDLLIAIATGGRSPALARFLRETLESLIDPAYGELLAILGDLRDDIRSRVPRSEQRSVWRELLDGRLLARLRSDGEADARLLARHIVDRHTPIAPEP